MPARRRANRWLEQGALHIAMQPPAITNYWTSFPAVMVNVSKSSSEPYERSSLSGRKRLRSAAISVGFDRRMATLQVFVRDNNVEQALRVLKKKMQREGVFREMRRCRFFEKPSERRVREKTEAIRRVRKLARKKAQREGLIPIPKRKSDEPSPRRPFPISSSTGTR
jgi:small subunit ribosomal protein S21